MAAQYLTERGYQTARIVVEINGTIVSKSQYADKTFAVGDNIGLYSSRVALCAMHEAHTVLRILAKEFE